jgi:hypothetical protein
VGRWGGLGGKLTGLALLAPELGGKRLEILKEVVPTANRVAVLGAQRGRREADLQFGEIAVAAR